MAAANKLEVMVVDDTSVSRMLMTESLQEIGITNLALAKDGAKIGFILVTGSPEKSLVDRGRQIGLNNFIAKPFTTKAIRAAIEAVVGRLT